MIVASLPRRAENRQLASCWAPMTLQAWWSPPKASMQPTRSCVQRFANRSDQL